MIDILPLDERYTSLLRLKINQKKVLDVVNETRTAVMFIECSEDINISLKIKERKNGK